MTPIFPSHLNFAQAARELVSKYQQGVDSSSSRPPSSTSSSSPPSLLSPSLANSGWTWMDHPKQPTFGYLRRSSTIVLPSSSSSARPRSRSPSPDDPEEEEDPSTITLAPSIPGEVISVIHHIVFSPTYRAPQLLIQAHSRTTFSPLSLSLLISLNLVRPPSPSSALASDATSIPLLAPTPSSEATTTTNEISFSSTPPKEFTDDHEADFPLLAQAEHPSTGEGVWALHPCHLQEALEEIIKYEEKGDVEGGSGGLRSLESWLMLVGTVVDLRWRR